MRRVSEYDKDDFLMYCVVVTDIDNWRVGVFVNGSKLVEATTNLSLDGVLYHVQMVQFHPSERPHRKAVEGGYLQQIADNWLLDKERVGYYTWLKSQKQARLKSNSDSEKYRQKAQELEKRYTVDKRGRYDNE